LFFWTSSSLFTCISCTSLWYCEGGIELGLEHGGVLPGLGEFFLQCLGLEHRVAEPLKHLGLLSGLLHDILQKGNNYLGTRSAGT
jgi:hypothetical protein